VYVLCVHAGGGRCAKTEQSSYGLCETENKRCSSCILTIKHVTMTNYYNNSLKKYRVISNLSPKFEYRTFTNKPLR